MFESFNLRLLRLLRVPPEPEPPFGAPGSLRVFRAGHNFFRLRLWLWGFKQVIALGAILFWAVIFFHVEQTLKARRQAGQTPATPAAVRDSGDNSAKNSPASVEQPTALTNASPEVKPDPKDSHPDTKKKRPRAKLNGGVGLKQALVEWGMWLPPWSFPLLWTLKLAGFVFYLAQVPFTYALMRLDYEQRWYVVTDRSLRLRTGVWSVREMTMSFANLQQITVTQGPLQRLLGLADVCVRSAGGGGAVAGHQGAALHSLHTGYFHAVDNAEAIRDLITERLRRFRESGLGDPEEKRHTVSAMTMVTTESATLAAAKELLVEARALRGVIG
jgi:membrane protein YdbS with pleckstrin-like domain